MGSSKLVLAAAVLALLATVQAQGSWWNQGSSDPWQNGQSQNPWENDRSQDPWENHRSQEESWGSNSNPWGQRGGGRSFNFQGRNTITATCVGKDSVVNPKVVVKATIKSSNPWFRTLRLVLRIDTGPGVMEDVKVVLTRFGAGDNTDGCTPDNLGDILVRRSIMFNPWGSSGNSDGVLDELSLEPNEDDLVRTINNLPISSIQEAFGISLAFCRDVEEVGGGSSDSGSNWGFNSFFFRRPQQPQRSRCADDVLLCCKFGRFNDDAQ